MSIGTGIFLASLLISLVILYTRTKDGWNWKKIFKIFSFILVGIPSLIGGIVWCANYYNDLPKVVNELQGIKLGYKKADVIFKLGESTASPESLAKLAELERLLAEKQARMQKNEGIKTADPELLALQRTNAELKRMLAEQLNNLTTFQHRENEHLHYQDLIITLQNDEVTQIQHICTIHAYKELNGIQCGNNSEDILHKYGSNIIQFNSKKYNDVRLYQSKTYNISYLLCRDKVIALIVGCIDFNQNENFVKEVK